MHPSNSHRAKAPLAIEGSKSGGMANTFYAKTARDYIELLRILRAGGAQTDVSLPRVAVIGNQSAGKSSLIEAIAQISVPRDAGTCTRCPMEIRLSSSNGSWTCRISLRWEYDEHRKPLTQHKEVPFGDPFSDKSQLELMLRRAQTAVLNQNHDPSYFIDKEGETLKLLAKGAKQSFSRNVVCVDISGPGLPDLSFIDLPGIIQYDDGKGEVKLVEDLARFYIQNHNTIILVVAPMSDDLHNQKAVQLAKEADRDGARTINVLTKPDALAEGSIDAKENWVQVMAGQEHPTKHGYFCVRLPDDAERREKISYAEAREREMRYFATVAPWCDTPQRNRYGIESLVQFLSERLMELSRASLPGIEREVDAQRTQCDQQLRELPLQTAEPYLHVHRMVTAFVDEVGKVVQGSPEHTALVQATKKMYAAFSAGIAQTAPPFVPFVRADGERYVPFVPTAVWTPDEIIYLDTVRERIERYLTRELPNNVPYSVKCAFILAFQDSWERHATRCFEQVRRAFKNELGRIVDAHFGRYEHLKRAISSIMLDLTNVHGTTTEQQLRFQLKYERNPPTTQNLDDLAGLREKHLSSYSFMLEQAAAGKLQPVLHAPAPADQGAQRVPGSASSASSQGFKPVFPPAVPKSVSSQIFTPAEAPATPSPQAHDGAKPQVHRPPHTASAVPEQGPLSPERDAASDKHGAELALMAEIRAYFDVASKRIQDSVTHVIDEHLLFSLAAVLGEGVLIERLGLGAEDTKARCAKYLEESADVAALREELRAKKKRLDDAQKALYEFGL
ncbi:hypothetical protein VTO73DRAFT_4529 [Trametes versicolor]